jgi:hypothetical protein
MEARGRRQITSPRSSAARIRASSRLSISRHSVFKIGDDTGALFNGEAGASFLVGRVKLRFAFSDHRFRHEKKTCEGVPVGVIRNSITRGMGCQCSAYLEMKAKDDEAVARENAA